MSLRDNINIEEKGLPSANYNLVVLGGGESGVGAALLGKKLGCAVFLSDNGQLAERYREILLREGIAYEEGGHSVSRIEEADVVVKSPGIPDTVPLVKALRERGIEVISEIEFAGRYTEARMIGITGSNGKTTTTLLLYHLLRTGKVDVGLSGNVGKSLAAQVARNAHTTYVVELSSFQLDGMSRFRCDAAILTNITPDHLDRYDYRFENYVAAKFRILNNMRPEDLFIYSGDDPVIAGELEHRDVLPERAAFTFGYDPSRAACMEGEQLHVRWQDRHFRINKREITIQGRHNVYNAMAAILAAMKCGVSDEDIREGLKTFPQVEHRLEKIPTEDGITWINDSKATNVDSTWYALDSVEAPVIWIAGGTDKGNEYEGLHTLVREKVKLLVCMGVDNRKLVESFTPICEVADTHSLEETMRVVASRVQSGDTVLLSPACASFDLFMNYEDRGRQFKTQVKSIASVKE